MTYKLSHIGCDVFREPNGSASIISPLAAKYLSYHNVMAVQPNKPKILHGNCKIVKQRYEANHAALRASVRG